MRWLCGGRGPSGEVEAEAWRCAICVAVDVFAEYGDGQVGGTPSAGSRRAATTGRACQALMRSQETALWELVGTSLLFAEAH